MNEHRHITLPGETPRLSIALETRRKSSIKNTQSRDITPLYKTVDRKYRLQYRNQPHQFRTPGPSAVYNCHGLTFASRRTTVWESSEIAKILDEDDYKEVKEKNILPGDLAVYYALEDGDPQHSAIVLKTEEVAGVRQIWVLSKWGHCSEVNHWLWQCPYEKCTIRFYRINE